MKIKKITISIYPVVEKLLRPFVYKGDTVLPCLHKNPHLVLLPLENALVTFHVLVHQL